MDWKKIRLNNFLVIDRNNLETIGQVRGKSKWFKGTRYLQLLIAGWLSTICFAIVFIFFYIDFQNEIYHLKKLHANELVKYNKHIDSLNFIVEEKNRTDTLMTRCFEIMTSQPKKISHDDLWDFIKSCNPWYPDIIMMQAVVESNCGESDVALRTNNLFGMKKPHARVWRCDKNRENKNETYMEFEDWRLSVIDRILWDRWIFSKYNHKPNIDEYMKVIGCVYNTETKDYAVNIYKNAAKYRKNYK